MQRILETHFRAILAEEGWAGADDFHWSLGYCQSSAVAFFGRVDDPAALVRRLAPPDLAPALSALFAGPEARGSIHVDPRRHGPGIPFMSANLDADGIFEPDDGDTAHQEIQKHLASEGIARLERALQDDVKRIAKRMMDEGYALIEAMDPSWWSPLPTVESRHEHHVVLRRIGLPTLRTEWRLLEPDFDSLDADEARWWAETLAGGNRACAVVCVLLDSNDEEIVFSSGYIVSLPAEGWRRNDALLDAMQEAFAEIKPEGRARLRTEGMPQIAPSRLRAA